MGGILNFFAGPPSGERLATQIARVIQKELQHAIVFKKEFYQAAGLDGMTDEDTQDMVQNLTMSALAMVYLTLDTAWGAVKNSEQKELYGETRNCLVMAYVGLLKGGDDPRDLLPNWNQVLARYCEDYRAIYRNEKESLPDIRISNPWVNIAGIGAAVRFRNAVPDSVDPLPEILIKIFGEMSGKVLDCVIKELGKIS